jgi:hypothetical protein
VSVQPAGERGDPRRGSSLARSREEHLSWARPLPPPEESAIEDLTDEEWQAFWDAISDL